MMPQAYSKCDRLCLHAQVGRCGIINDIVTFGYDDDAPFYARYYAERDTVNCKKFKFDSQHIPVCGDCKNNPIRHNSSKFCGRPHIISDIACKVYARIWWKFGRPK